MRVGIQQSIQRLRAIISQTNAYGVQSGLTPEALAKLCRELSESYLDVLEVVAQIDQAQSAHGFDRAGRPLRAVNFDAVHNAVSRIARIDVPQLPMHEPAFKG